MSLRDGDIVFYTREAEMAQMLSALLGVSGEAFSAVSPRLRIADADDDSMRDAAWRDAMADGAPIVFFGVRGTEHSPPAIQCVCLPRPFLLSDMAEAVETLCGERSAETRQAEPQLALAFDPASRTVRCGAQSVRLSERTAAVFAMLYERSPEPVPEETLRALFPGTRGNNAAVHISHLRRALASLSCTATVSYLHGRGYALLLPGILTEMEKRF